MDLNQLRSLKTADQLANQLNCSYNVLGSLLYGPAASANYRVFQVAKRSGGFRTIAAPRPELRAIQHEILEALTQAYQKTRSAYGFVRGRSIVDGARPHVGRRIVVNLDLADFFPSITFWRVRGLFLSEAFGLPYDVATVLAQICCSSERLPQGAPTSPIISNFVCSGMDRELGALVGTCGGRYSRYCDDLTMSFDSELVVSKSIARKDVTGLQINPSVEKIIRKHGFTINFSKFKLRTNRERQEVTGLVVNRKVNVRRALIKTLHTQLHCIEKFGLGAASETYYELQNKPSDEWKDMHFAAAIRGRILFVKMVRGNGDPIFAKLAKRFNHANIYPRKIKYYKRPQSVVDLKEAVWVVEIGYDDPDWGNCNSQGTAFLLDGVGLVTCAHVVVNDKSNRPFREIEVFRVGSMLRYRAYVASYDPKFDLAVLYVDGINYVKDCDVRLKLSSIDHLIGQQVQMVGFPSYREGQSLFVSRTEVAAVHGQHMEVGGQVIAGISGGPLLDENYMVVGVLVRGVPGGGAKNEAVLARNAFYLDFKRQNLELLGPMKSPPARGSRTPWRRFVAWFGVAWGRRKSSG